MKKAYGIYGIPLKETIIGVSTREKSKKWVEKLFKEIMTEELQWHNCLVRGTYTEIRNENFPNLVRDLDNQIYEANRSSQNFNAKQFCLRQITIKW